jgi:protein gp37
MVARSKVSWTHYSYNPWRGCQKCGHECKFCFIYRDLRKHHLDAFAADGPYRTKTTGDAPYEIQESLPPGVYARVFTCSHGDFFDRRVDSRGWRDEAWRAIRDTPNCVYLILTKRPERIADHLPADWPYPNVWLGTSTGCNATLARVDHLRQVPIHPEAVRFVSAEPLLESISARLGLDGIGWLIVGGESGDNPEYRWTPEDQWHGPQQHGRRTMGLAWAYRLMLAARRQGIPFYFKQVTATRSGQGIDALGQIYHEFPPPPNGGVWMAENPLEVIQ